MTSMDMRDAFFERLLEVAQDDSRIIVLSADHGALALSKFESKFSSRYINMGIAEQNMVGVAAGLANSGKVVFIYGISPFVSLRVLEQLTVDVAAMNLAVNVISVGAGLTYSTDSSTHLGLQDIGAISSIPGMNILNSSDPINTKAFVDIALTNLGPNYIRIEKEKLDTFTRINSGFIEDGYSILSEINSDFCVVSTGALTHICLNATIEFTKLSGISVCVIDVHNLKYPKVDSLAKLLEGFKKIVSFEENYLSGLASFLSKIYSNSNINNKITSIGIPEEFIFRSCDRESLRKTLGLSYDEILEVIQDNFKDKP